MSEDVIVYGVLVLLATGALVWALAGLLALVGLVRGLVWLVCRTVRAVAGRRAPADAEVADHCPICKVPTEYCQCGVPRPRYPRVPVHEGDAR